MRRLRPAPLVVLVVVLSFPLLVGADGLLTTFDPQLAVKVRSHDYKKAARTGTVPAASVPTERLSGVDCEGGKAGPFTCDGIDLLSFVPYSEFAGVEPTAFPGISDIWGWTDDATGREYVIIGVSNGVNFFDVTDPTAPVDLGKLPNHAAAQLIWHDIKVFEDHAYIVSESNPHGMQVFDLTRLRNGPAPNGVFEPDTIYPLNVAAHNLAINEDTGYAYLVGGNEAILLPDQCNYGLHMIDLSVPDAPAFAGCFGDDGYVHDVQCVVYHGPDAEHRDKEICVGSNEDTLTIVDVTDKSNPTMISRTTYPEAAYTHQGWFTEDQRWFLTGDELDEQDHEMNTRTIIFDLQDLDAPSSRFHEHDTTSIDHNMYVEDGLVYQSNYTTGLRVLDTRKLAAGDLPELAFFDTFPEHDDPTFHGTWSNYPYFESGTIAVSGIDEGLFLLRLDDEVAAKAHRKPAPGSNGRGPR